MIERCIRINDIISLIYFLSNWLYLYYIVLFNYHLFRGICDQNDISNEINCEDTLEINWNLIDDSLIDILVPVLNSKTKFSFLNWKSLNNEKIQILENIFDNFLENDHNNKKFLALFPSYENSDGYEAIIIFIWILIRIERIKLNI